MKRFHPHVSGANLDESIRVCSKLFAIPPPVQQIDYTEKVVFATHRGHEL